MNGRNHRNQTGVATRMTTTMQTKIALTMTLALALQLSGCAGQARPAQPGLATSGGGQTTAAPVGPGATLDALLIESWRAAGVTPAPIADDGEFLRRVTLDLVGRVPTLDEISGFLSDRAPDKRARLVD